jgi:hypothetical protein
VINKIRGELRLIRPEWATTPALRGYASSRQNQVCRESYNSTTQHFFSSEIVSCWGCWLLYAKNYHSSHFPSVKTWAYIRNFSSSLQSICKQDGCAHFMHFPFLQSVAEKGRQKLILGFMFCLTWLLWSISSSAIDILRICLIVVTWMLAQ